MTNTLLAHETEFWVNARFWIEFSWYHPDYPEKGDIDILATYSNLFFPPMEIKE